MAYYPPYGQAPGYNPPGPWPPGPPNQRPPGPYPPTGAYPPGPPTAGPPVPVINPPVPFLMPLPPIQDGLMVVIQGQVSPKANRFYINLSTGAGYDEAVPVALHFNPRFEGTNQVIRNSFLTGSWGPEEREGHFPFAVGGSFECILLMTTASFKVAVNGQHFCDFAHRTVMQNVSHLAVDGDITLQSVRVQPPAGFQPPPMGPPPPYNPPLFVTCPPQPRAPPPPTINYNLPVPCHSPIFNGLHPGSVIKISGMPKAHGNGFAINLCYHDDTKHDVALHMNPRLNKKEVVFNTRAGYTWGREQRIRSPLFFPEQHFNVVIAADNTKYTISLNGQPIYEYEHRLKNLRLVRFLSINGDVLLSNVTVQ